MYVTQSNNKNTYWCSMKQYIQTSDMQLMLHLDKFSCVIMSRAKLYHLVNIAFS